MFYLKSGFIDVVYYLLRVSASLKCFHNNSSRLAAQLQLLILSEKIGYSAIYDAGRRFDMTPKILFFMCHITVVAVNIRRYSAAFATNHKIISCT